MSHQFFYPAPAWKDRDLTGFTVIVPTVSIGNVPQLVVDILLANLTLPNQSTPSNSPCYEFLGSYIDPFALEPYCVVDPFAPSAQLCQGRVHSAIELYCVPEHKIIIVQQRAFPIHHRSRTFYKLFASFIVTNLRPASILLLTSTTNQHREDDELRQQQDIQFFSVEPACAVIPSDFEQQNIAASNPHYVTALHPPQAALEAPLASLAQTLLQLSPTRYQDEHLDGFHAIKHQSSHGAFLYGDGSLLSSPSQSTQQQASATREKSLSEKLFFPIPRKGGGLMHALTKACRRHDVPLLALVSLNHRGDTRQQALTVYSLLSRFLMFIVQTAVPFNPLVTASSFELNNDVESEPMQAEDAPEANTRSSDLLAALQRRQPLTPLVWRTLYEEQQSIRF